MATILDFYQVRDGGIAMAAAGLYAKKLQFA